MLRIQKLDHLAKNLGYSLARIRAVAENTREFVTDYQLLDPSNPNKIREVLGVSGTLRTLQYRILSRLLRSDPPSSYSHGGIKERSIFTNAAIHKNSAFGYKTDISNFYPSIHYKRVYRYFNVVQKCSSDVSRLLTQLTTLRHQIPLGLITSPFLADRIIKPVDARIAKMCEDHGVKYTRFVDDIVLSGKFDLEKSGFPRLVREVLEVNGFRVNQSKDVFGDFQDGFVVTGIRIRNGGIDVQKCFADKIEQQIDVAYRLSLAHQVSSPFATENQVRGRLMFVKQVNFQRYVKLRERFDAICWDRATANAQLQDLIVPKKRLAKISN